MMKFVRCLLALLTVSLALSCVTAKKIIGPDGTENHLVSCERIDKCYEKAREVCGGNYKIVNTASESLTASTFSGSEQTLLVKCEKY